MTQVLPFPERLTRISAVILTRNEEPLIERCLLSVRDVVDEIIVVDSWSTDRTPTIAMQHGARVVQQSWLGWVPQRALGIELARHDWVLILEADEIVTPRLAQSIREVTRRAMHPDDGYSIDRRDDFLGAILPRMRRRSKRDSYVRIFNRTRSAYDPALIVHDEVRFPGRAIPLEGALIHWRGFSIAEQVSRYASYAPLEATVLEGRGVRVSVLSLIVRPFVRFVWCYVVCGGFRLGARGLAHALMVASSEYLRFATTWERQNASPTPHPPRHVAEAFGLVSSADTTAPTHATDAVVARSGSMA